MSTAHRNTPLGPPFAPRKAYYAPDGFQYWCEECRRYRSWPGPDYGDSHWFCDECLEKLELEGFELEVTP